MFFNTHVREDAAVLLLSNRLVSRVSETRTQPATGLKLLASAPRLRRGGPATRTRVKDMKLVVTI